MEVQLRPAATRFHPLVRPRSRIRGFSGLGQSINPTTIWTPQSGWLATAGDPTSAIAPPATYVAPNHVPIPACTQDTRPGGAAFSAECIAALLAAQQANMAADSAANKAVFVANCNADWEANAARYTQLGMAVPPNDCAYREYGLTLPGTTGSSTGYVPGTPQGIIDWRAANPGGGSPGPAAGGGVPIIPGAPQFTFTNLTSGNNSSFVVGDRWEVRITGAQPGRGVSVSGGKDGANANTQMGLVDSSGNYTRNGQMTQAEVGNWAEIWAVNNQPVANFTFKVSPAGTATGTGTGGGQSAQTPSIITKKVSSTLPGGSVSIGGMDIPVWGLGLAAVAAYFLFMRGK